MPKIQGLETKTSGTDRPGVGGWLLFLCITLVFLHPLNMLRGINLRAAEAVQAEYPRAMTLALIDSFVGVVLSIYSIYTGLRLWRVRPNAVSNAKRFLLISWLYFLLSRAALFTIGFPPQVNAMLLKRALVYVPIFTFIVIIWWLYLGRSHRVARLYGNHRLLPRDWI